MRLENKVAVVTGAASGMGKAIAELYAKEGAKVIVSDLNLAGAEEVAAGINSIGGEAVAVKTNVAHESDINEMIDLAIFTFGGLDILVNNAGIMDDMAPVGDVLDGKWELMFDVNTKSVMRAIRKAIPIFLEQGNGIIVNVASTGGFSGAHAGVAYTASKHAVVGITKNTGFMYAQKGIRCNAIAPGATMTNIVNTISNVNELGAARTKVIKGVIPRLGQPEEIAQVALFLASDESSFVNGAVITADAGWTAGF
ncbi:SDR family oxidoreductase [Paenibacillus sonchi]|uniref:SDR family oxidoreductase n=1 Tax=Paenibacillus sonchi TaxID=373687 RepID=A0A974SFU2_9BACL|nr:SDR family oxidoreductase [Paenibacillus sonchi]QQZ63879.1 SDR family oxidoreductase [Paenibacillus sonchi]